MFSTVISTFHNSIYTRNKQNSGDSISDFRKKKTTKQTNKLKPSSKILQIRKIFLRIQNNKLSLYNNAAKTGREKSLNCLHEYANNVLYM